MNFYYDPKGKQYNRGTIKETREFMILFKNVVCNKIEILILK